MWPSDLRPHKRSAAGTVARGFQRGVPFGLLGLFQQHEVMRLGKSPNRLWLFCEEKPRAQSGRMVGDGSFRRDCAGDNPGDVITCNHATVCILSRASDCAGNRSDRCVPDRNTLDPRRYYSSIDVPVRQSLSALPHRYRRKHELSDAFRETESLSED